MFVYGLIDIDDFTTFNLLNSFEKGNEVLNKLENISKNILLPLIWLKLGSDEFVFSLVGSFEENKQNISELLITSKKQLNITISVGLIEVDDEYEFQKIINLLKRNLLTAKKNGKNKMCLT